MSQKVMSKSNQKVKAGWGAVVWVACSFFVLSGCVQETSTRVAEGQSRNGETVEPEPEAAAVEVEQSVGPTRESESPPRRLTNSASSEWELAEWVLDALKARDAKALHSLRINATEFRDYVFPGSPEAKGTIPVDFQWYYLNVRSFAGVQEAIDEYGGLDLELLDVIPTRGIKEYDGYKMWSYVELMVRFPDGHEQQIKVFGSVVDMDGEFKILAFPT